MTSFGRLSILKGLVPQERFGQMARAVMACLARLYPDETKPPSDAVVGDVFDRCCEIVRVLVGDMKWPLSRALDPDQLLPLLRAHLDGKFEPSRRQSWARVVDDVEVTVDDLVARRDQRIIPGASRDGGGDPVEVTSPAPNEPS